MKEVLRRISYRLNRRRLEREMAEEMAYHRELLTPERRTGFGSELRLREDTRVIWGWTWFDRLGQDLRYGVRVLRQSPGFTLTAMVVLSLGIAVPLTAFREVLVDLRGTAPDPDTLVELQRRAPGMASSTIPYPELEFYATHANSFRPVVGVLRRNQATFGDIEPGSSPEEIHVMFVTANYFREFGVTPAHGRLLTSDDERADADPVALLGELFWQRRLGGDLGVIGQTLRVNGKPVRVVGVAPRSAETDAALWMPLVRQPYVVEGSTLLADWNAPLDMFARLKPGVSPKAAEEESRALAAKLREARPDNVWKGEYLNARPVNQLEHHGSEWMIQLTAVALVMLLLMAACANLGTLVLARGATREREIRTRMALGAGRWRVVRQLFTESVMLALLGGAAALGLSSIVLKIIHLQHNSGLSASVLPDWTALGATMGIALAAALVFGLPPALRLTDAVPRAGRARTIFIGLQVGASCLLLVVSSLLVRGLDRLKVGDLGFDYRPLVWISPGLNQHGYRGPAARAFLDSLRAQVAGMSGVLSASEVWLAPLNVHSGVRWQGHEAFTNHVDAQFLDTMGMRLVRGRNFRPGEQGVVVISQSLQRLLWPDREAIGQPVPWDRLGPKVIGVVRDASTAVVGDPAPLEFYQPQSMADAPEACLLLRVSGRPSDFVRRLQDTTRTLDKRLQPGVQLVKDSYDREVERVSHVLMVISVLGTVAILLAAIGLAGLAGYTVAQRTREIGVRMALGARAGQVVRAILAPMSRPVAIGFACGAFAGSAVGRILRSGAPGMGGLNLLDPVAYLMAAAFFFAVVALAVVAPARRALRINPGHALQHE